MNILHIIVGLESGGAERMLQRLVLAGGMHGASRHAVISLTGLGQVGRELQHAGIAVEALGMRSFAGLPRVWFRLVQAIRRFRPDVVQTWMYHADFLGGLAARWASNCPVVWGVRTTDVPARGAPVTALLRWVCARLSYWVPDRIVCAAQASLVVHAAIGYDARKLEVISNGYDFTRWTATDAERRAVRAGLGIADDELVVGSVGRLHADKDHENFIRMAGLLAARMPRLRFLLVGRGLEAGNASLGRWLADSGAAARFILAAERTDVPQCLAAMDVFCLHSRNEGFPNVLAEAMAMGLPCVTTDVGDAAMLIANTGVVVPKQDPVRLASAVEHLLTGSQAERKALGAAARARIRTRFDIDTMRQRFDTLYRQLVEGAGR